MDILAAFGVAVWGSFPLDTAVVFVVLIYKSPVSSTQFYFNHFSNVDEHTQS